MPELIALGFAAFIRFMKVTKDGDKYTGEVNGQSYLVTDAQAADFYKAWTNAGAQNVVTNVLGNKALWDTDLTALPGFAAAVTKQLEAIEAQGALEVLENETKSFAK